MGMLPLWTHMLHMHMLLLQPRLLMQLLQQLRLMRCLLRCMQSLCINLQCNLKHMRWLQMTYGAAPTMPMDHMQQPPAYTQAATHYDMSGGAGLHQAQSMLMHPGMTPQFQFTPSGVAEPVQQVAVAPAPAPAPAAVEMPAQQTPDAAEKKPTGKRDKKKAGKTKKTCC